MESSEEDIIPQNGAITTKPTGPQLPPIQSSVEQLAVVAAVNHGNVQVDAVAGSGKSNTAYLISRENSTKSIVILTYNKALKLGMDAKIKELQLRCRAFTYHGFATRYYGICHNDKLMSDILRDNTPPREPFLIDILIIDEAQDMNPTYYDLVRKILRDNRQMERRVHMCLFGDKYQAIYDFLKSSSQFLTLSDKIFGGAITNNAVAPNWQQLSLSTSYRMTRETAAFLNNCVLRHGRINAVRRGPRPKYIICNSYGYAAAREVQRLLKIYAPCDIFIVAHTVRAKIKEGGKQANSPASQLANYLTKLKIKIFVPGSDEEKINEDQIRDKVVFSSYHQTKGLERRAVILFGFDSRNPTLQDCSRDCCPNPMYVALTRALDELIIIHDEKYEYPSFVNRKLIPLFADVQCESPCKIGKTKPHVRKGEIVAVTDLVRYLPFDVIDEITNLLTIRTIRDRGTELLFPHKTSDPSNIETVSEINGTAIPAIFEYMTMQHMSIYERLVRLPAKFAKTLREYPIPPLSRLIQCGLDPASIDNLLYLATVYCAHMSGYNFKLDQIKRFDWLNSETIEAAVDRIAHVIDDRAVFEEPLASSISYRGMEICVTGAIDCRHTSTIYEFKCTSDIAPEHIIQLALYAYLWETLHPESPQQYQIYNIRTDEMLEITAPYINLKKIIAILLEFRYFTNHTQPDAEFIDLITARAAADHSRIAATAIVAANNNTVRPLCETITFPEDARMIIDIETDGKDKIINLAYEICDRDFNSVAKQNIIINDQTTSTDLARKIPLATIRRLGVSPRDAMTAFDTDMQQCKHIIGHNIVAFDRVKLAKFMDVLEMEYEFPQTHDTMTAFKRQVGAKTKTGRAKAPTLAELYHFATGNPMCEIRAHLADFDVACTVEAIRALHLRNIKLI